jgi:hypothetical protein
MNDLKYANLCAPGMMSLCTVGKHWKDQQTCKFYRKASVDNRCMYYRESLGSHCDCVAAQIEIRKYWKRNLVEKCRSDLLFWPLWNIAASEAEPDLRLTFPLAEILLLQFFGLIAGQRFAPKIIHESALTEPLLGNGLVGSARAFPWILGPWTPWILRASSAIKL